MAPSTPTASISSWVTAWPDAGKPGECPVVYSSDAPYLAERIGAAAVYCSDGRLGAAFDDFLQSGLLLPRYDRLAVPGGAACLSGHFETWKEEEAAINQIRFLVEVHGLRRVVLIAHEGCAFYTERLRVSKVGLLERQREDLAKAVRRVRELQRDLEVEAYFARLDSDAVRFEHLEL